MKAGPLHIAERIDAWHVRLQPLVHLDIAAFVGGDASRRQVQRLGVWDAARRRQHVRAGEIALAIRRLHVQRYVHRQWSSPHRPAIQQDLDAIFRQNPRHGLGNVGILTAQQSHATLDDRHLAAKAAEHLSELQPDVAAAHYQQVSGHDSSSMIAVEFRARAVKSRHSRASRAAHRY